MNRLIDSFTPQWGWKTWLGGIIFLFLALTANAQSKDSDYPMPEVNPEFPGGNQQLMYYLAKNINYPEESKREGKEGRVVVQFDVNIDGTIASPRVVSNKSGDKRLEVEALRVIGAMPAWKPGTVGGKPVKVKMNIPVAFRLQKDSNALTDYSTTLMAEVDRVTAGKSDTPRGLYRMLRISYDDGRPAITPNFERYKYCFPQGTLQLEIAKSLTDDFQMMVRQMESKPVMYTGNTPQGENGKGKRIFDTGDRGFKLMWYNNWYGGGEDVYPLGHFITEHYYKGVATTPDVDRILELASMHLRGTGNKLYGSWYRVGALASIDGSDVIVTAPEQLYCIFDEDVYFHLYDLTPGGMLQCYCILRPVTYHEESAITMYGLRQTVTWINDETIRLTYVQDGKTVTELWKRSGLPESLQAVIGTSIPVFHLDNPIPSRFR